MPKSFVQLPPDGAGKKVVTFTDADSNHYQAFAIGPATSATVSNVTAAIADTQLVAANANRRGFILFNDSTSVLYMKFGTGASTTSFTVPIAAADYYEMPEPVYAGQINGIWLAANGAARITELI